METKEYPVNRYAPIPVRVRTAGVTGAATAGAIAIILIVALLWGLGRSKPLTAADALKVALSQVGTTENAAGGSKFNQWFMTTSAAKRGVAQNGGSVSDYANASWCDMFVSWIGDRLGVRGMGADAFTPDHAKWFIAQGRWGNVPKPGAVVFFSWNGGGINGIDHVGLVIKDNHDGTIQTVEGNTDDAVKVRTRPVSEVVGYGYPDYAQ